VPGALLPIQRLHAEAALQRASTAGIEWLLHIDIDELFFVPSRDAPSTCARGAAVDHFKQLSRQAAAALKRRRQQTVASPAAPAGVAAAEALWQVVYLNHEAAPASESAGVPSSRFRAPTMLFKRSLQAQPGAVTELLSHTAVPPDAAGARGDGRRSDALVFWAQRLRAATLLPSPDGPAGRSSDQGPAAAARRARDDAEADNEAYARLGTFMGYTNGKSAICVPEAISRNALPAGSHRWRSRRIKEEDSSDSSMEPTADGSAEDAATEGMAAEAALADGQYELALNNADAPMVDPKDACVLHYANLGIEAFVDKYTLRRSERWNMLPFHVAAVTAANETGEATASGGEAAGSEATGDEAAAELLRVLYRRTVLLDDEDEAARQVLHGVCFPVEGVASVIDSEE
jgi:hypothetical protein